MPAAKSAPNVRAAHVAKQRLGCSCDSCAVCDGAGCGIGGGGSKDCIYLRASIKLI